MAEHSVDEPIYAWQVFGPDARWGMVAAVVESVSSFPIPLVTRDRAVAVRWRVFAEMHHASSGLPLRLARYELTNIEETIP